MMTLFKLGAVLWLLSLAAFLIGGRLSTVGRRRTSGEVFLFTSPFSALGAVMMIPALPMIGEESAFQDALLITLMVLWAGVCLLVANTCMHMRVFLTDEGARP
ncbi:hypothetical protein IU491_29170, partial [Nocardia cyriacigeorgica]